MNPNSTRFQYYEEGIQADEAGLFNDIRLWHSALPKNTPIEYHVGQFHSLCRQAIDCLMDEYKKKSPLKAKDKQLAFQSRIVGALVTQWMLLRQVAEQRLQDSPYQQGLEELDKLAANYYHRLRSALPEKTRDKISPSPPLVYLGRIAELTLFSQKAPSALSVPLGAVNDDNEINKTLSRHTIPHEVAHAVFNQLTDFIPELELSFLHSLSQASGSDRQQRILQRVIQKWLNEIVADLAGTALAGESFAKSAAKIMILPDEVVGVTDATHPVPIIRSYVHLTALKYLRGEDEIVNQLKVEIEQINGDYINRRFDSCPDLTVVSLKTVKEEMVKAIQSILDDKLVLDSLGKKPIGEILRDCQKSLPVFELDVNDENLFPRWGDSLGDCDNFVLRLVGSLRPEHASPVTFPFWLCCLLGIEACCP